MTLNDALEHEKLFLFIESFKDYLNDEVYYDLLLKLNSPHNYRPICFSLCKILKESFIKYHNHPIKPNSIDHFREKTVSLPSSPSPANPKN